MTRAASTARSGATRLRGNPVFRTLARVGFAMTGLLHVLIGVIALSVAFGSGGGEADQSGALGQLASNPVGMVLLWVITVGLFALGLFLLVSAVVGGGETKERVSDGAKAVAYIAVGVTALRFATGGSSDSSQQSQGLSAKLLSAPGGVVLLIIIGLGAAGVGIYFIVKGVRKKFVEDITVPRGTAGTATVATGRVGYIAKGLAIVVVGILFVVAAATADPDKATGLDGALKSLASLPFGVVILTAVAIGLIAYGVYCFIRARYAKL